MVVRLGSTALGQTVLTTPATIATATGRTVITPFADGTMPATIGYRHRWSIATWVTPSRLGSSELRTVYGQAGYHQETWSAAVLIGALGMDRYTELNLSALGSIALSDALTIGATCAYTFARARGFAAEHILVINAQMLFALDTLTVIGAVGTNIGQAERSGSSAGALSQFRIGISRTIADGLTLDADVVLPLRLASGLAVALGWDALDILRLRAAYSTVPQSAEVSIALAVPGELTILGTLHYHLSLGASPTIGIGYQW